MRARTPPPLSLYVHLPWCVKKCPYCDFNSHVARGEPPRDAYVEALVRDLDAESQRAGGRELVSVFIGGGTPSLFTGSEIAVLLEAIAGRFTLTADIEITMEANPGAIERCAFSRYRRAGVNRLSLGAQSFDDQALRRLGRIHSVADIRGSFSEARRAGFDNINLDLMFALPEQDLDAAIADVTSAVALAPEHLSHYQLTLEPNTAFHHSPPPLPDTDLAWAMQEECHARLDSAGYRRYEVSAFALAGRECRHNENYWRFGDYLAAGAGAHGKFTDSEGRVWRYSKPANPRAYMESMRERDPAVRETAVGHEDLAFEYMLNALRLTSGFSLREFASRTGIDPATISPAIEVACQRGLLERRGDSFLRPSELGFRFLDDLQETFLPPAGAANG